MLGVIFRKALGALPVFTSLRQRSACLPGTEAETTQRRRRVHDAAVRIRPGRRRSFKGASSFRASRALLSLSDPGGLPLRGQQSHGLISSAETVAWAQSYTLMPSGRGDKIKN